MGRETNKSRRASTEQSARARAAAMRIEQQRKERRRRLLTVTGAVIAVIVVVVVIILVGVNGGSNKPAPKATRPTLASSVVQDIAQASPTALSKAGSGTGKLSPAGLPQKTTGDPALMLGGKPEVLYIGAEFCPYCAAERWSLAVALSRFGQLSGLQAMHSSPSDADPNTPTITFLNAHYASKYIAFKSIENEDINHNKLQPTTAAETQLWTKYTNTQGTGPGYPFIDFGGKTVIPGPTYDPAILANMTQAQVAAQINNPTSTVGQAIDATANNMTAAICQATGNKPASVCTPSIQALGAKFATAKTYSTATGG